MKLAYLYMAIFFTFSPTSSHLYPLQVENCDSNSRLVVDKDDNVKSGLKGSANYDAGPTLGLIHHWVNVSSLIYVQKNITYCMLKLAAARS